MVLAHQATGLNIDELSERDMSFIIRYANAYAEIESEKFGGSNEKLDKANNIIKKPKIPPEVLARAKKGGWKGDI